MSHSPKTVRRCLHGGSWSLVAAAAMVGAWGVWPVGYPAAESATRRPLRMTRNIDASSDLISSEWLQRPLQGKDIAEKPDVRKPVVVKTQPKPKPVLSPVTRSIGLRLVGTVIEDGQGLAITSDRNGDIAFSRVGQSVSASQGSAVVEKITKNVVLIRYQGKRTRMEIGQELTMRDSSAPANLQRPANQGTQPRDTEESSVSDSDDSSDDFDMYDDSDIPNDRTPISPDEFPEMSLEDELEFLNGF